MKMRSFLYCTTIYCIATCLLNLVNTNAKEVSFQATGSTRTLQSENTVERDSTSIVECALECLSHRQCCAASFCTGTSTCRFDISEKCCINTETKNGWRTIRRNNYPAVAAVNAAATIGAATPVTACLAAITTGPTTFPTFLPDD